MPTLHWIGKEKVINHHLDVPYKVLEHTYHFDNGIQTLHSPTESSVQETIDDSSNKITTNHPSPRERGRGEASKIIHGDNLEALKSLLPEYEGKIKCIYIDPPYNTGNEGWVYNDNVTDPKIKKWLGQVVGKEGDDLTRHDKWLCMMYPRLILLHKLLANDGVIFVSIDDNEVHNLRPLINEIFGESNRIEQFIWKKSYGGGAKERYAITVHEYILLYAKNKEAIAGLWLPPDPAAEKRYYKYSDSKVGFRGPYRVKPLEATKSMDKRENLIYPIIAPDGTEVWPERQWWWSKERAYAALAADELSFTTKKTGGWSISYKQYLNVESGEQRKSKPFSIIDGIYTQQGSAELLSIFTERLKFQFPKPSSLIELCLTMLGIPISEMIVLDSFAGSGTTAHAVLNLNKKDGGHRKFILIEIEDYAETITAERVKRVINGYGDKEGTGGSFDFYTLGEPMFDDEGLLNEKVGVEKIRQYVYYTETKQSLNRDFADLVDFTGETKDHHSFMGKHNDTAYYFHYDPEQVTTLNHDFLAALKTRAEQYVIYADNCVLTRDFMTRHHLIFKKIPRDITRF